MTLSTRKQLRDTVLHMWDGFTDQSFYESTLAAVGDAAYASNSFTVGGTGSVTFTSVTLSDFTVSAFVTLDAFGGELVGGSDSISFPNSTTIRATIDSVDHDWTVAALSTGVEYHVLITRTGSTLTLYLDNASQGTKTASADVTFSDAFDGADGSFADIRIRKVATTAGFVSLLYSKGVAGFEPFLNLGGETLSIQPSRYTGSGDLLDQSGNGNDVTLPSGYSVADGVITTVDTANGPNTGVSFDGVAGSASMWVKSTDTNVIGLYQAASRFALCWEDGGSGSTATGVSNVILYVDGAQITDNRNTFHDAVADGTWHHIAMTGDFDAGWSTVHLFRAVSGVLWRMNGETDDIRLEAGRKWSAEEIKLLASERGVELPNVRDAVLAYLPSYDDASNGSTSLIDYSGNQTTGTISGGPTWNTTDTSEGGTRSIESTGAGSVSFDDSGLPLGDSERSIVTWVRVDDYSNDTQWFEYGTDATGQRFGIGVRNTDWMVVAINGAAVGTQNTPAAGTWAPVIVTYAGDGAAIDTVTFYIDGVAYSASTQSGTGSNVPGTVSGAGALLASIVSGNIEAAIDDVLVYDRVLSSAEIADFSQNRNIFEAAPVVTPGTWKIDTLLFS